MTREEQRMATATVVWTGWLMFLVGVLMGALVVELVR